MDHPQVDKYKDLHSEMKTSPLSYELACEYMSQYGVDFDDTVTELYNETFLLYVRLCSTDQFDYVRSACWAEMRKKTSYFVDISLKRNGQVNEAQCECGAGEGPTAHCKHVRTVLFACCKFISTGKMNVEMSCTEKLQSFHKVKKHTGTPLKSRDLNIAGSDEICDIQTFDPRPQQYRNNINYTDYFYNTCMNFKGISRTPIFQSFEPANVRAYALDHDYQKETPEEMFLKAMKITEISEEEQAYLEMYTRGQDKNDRWFEERKKRIQSSNFHRICHVTERTNHHRYAASLVNSSSIKQNEAMKHGHKFEKEAIHKYESDSGAKVKQCGIFVSTTLPFLGASPDGIVSDSVLCEVKCPFSARNKDISPRTVPYMKAADGNLTLSTTHPYYYQIQGQLFCAKRQFCDLIVYTLSDVKYVRIQRDDKFISGMTEKLELFYRNFFRSAILSKHFYREEL